LRGHLRLHRKNDGIGFADRTCVRQELHAALRQIRDLGRRLRLDHGDTPGVEPGCQPALDQSGSHLAGSDQNKPTGKTLQIPRCFG
jgi:hypothetical protein